MTKEQAKAICRLNLHKDTKIKDNCCIVNAEDIDKLMQAVKQLNKEVKELENKIN